MKKKLYYVVEKELSTVNHDGNVAIEETTGNKTISVYEIVDDEPKRFIDIDTFNEENSESAIKNYLDDNGYGDDEFELKQL